MKIQSLFSFLIVTVLLASCGSDEVTSGNSIKIDGQSFKVVSASLLGVSISGEGHAAISLTSIASSSSTKTLTLDFEYSPSAPVAGNYSFPQTGTDRYLDDFLTNYTEMTISGTGSTSTSTNLDFGKITVQDHGGDNYTVTIDITMMDGTVIKGKYRGDFVVMFNNS
jgi:hypothetical protein